MHASLDLARLMDQESLGLRGAISVGDVMKTSRTIRRLVAPRHRLGDIDNRIERYAQFS